MGKSLQSLKVTQIMTGCPPREKGHRLVVIQGQMVSLENKIQVTLYKLTEHIRFRSIYAYTKYVYQCNNN